MSALKKLKELIVAKFSKEEQAELETIAKGVKLSANVVGYNVDGGQPVYVDISDDGLPGIDADDLVYSDANGTTTYPDGTYKVTGTDFSFTVAGGIVTLVTDPDGKGAGNPIDNSAAPANPDAAADPAVAQMSKLETQLSAQKESFEKIVAELRKDNVALKKALAVNAKAITEILNTELAADKPARKLKKYEDMTNTERVKYNRGEAIYE